MADESSGWIRWLTNQPGHDWMVAVDDSFIEDAFNLYGLRSAVPRFRDCLVLMLGPEPDPDEDGYDDKCALLESARDLYGLIHARFILTSRGVSLMLAKYEGGEFGACPRYLCHGAACLPMGLSNNLREGGRVKLFCPRCEDVYVLPRSSSSGGGSGDDSKDGSDSDGWGARGRGSGDDDANDSDDGDDDGVGPSAPGGSSSSSRAAAAGVSSVAVPGDLDGAYFGPSFPHMLLLMKPQLLPVKPPETYVPRIYGFRVHNQRGRAPLTVGDSRGAYAVPAQLEAPLVTAAGAGGSSSAAAAAAPSGAAGTPKPLWSWTSMAPVAAPAAAARAAQGEEQGATAAGSAASSAGTSSSGGAAAAAAAAGDDVTVTATTTTTTVTVAARLRAQPKAWVSHSLASGPPATLAPYTVPVTGIPGGLPVYADAAAHTVREAHAEASAALAAAAAAVAAAADGAAAAPPASAPTSSSSSAAAPAPASRRRRAADGTAISSGSNSGEGEGAGALPRAGTKRPLPQSSSPAAGGSSKSAQPSPSARLTALSSGAGSGGQVQPASASAASTSAGAALGASFRDKVRHGVPLTSPYDPAGRKPAADDFNDTEGDEEGGGGGGGGGGEVAAPPAPPPPPPPQEPSRPQRRESPAPTAPVPKKAKR